MAELSKLTLLQDGKPVNAAFIDTDTIEASGAWSEQLSKMSESFQVKGVLLVDRWEYYLRRGNRYFFRNNAGEKVIVDYPDLHNIVGIKYHELVDLEFGVNE